MLVSKIKPNFWRCFWLTLPNFPILCLAEECARLYEHAENAGTTVTVNDGDQYDFVKWGISTMLVKAGCSIETFEAPHYNGGSWTWAAEATDEIYRIWEMAETTGRHFPNGQVVIGFDWNDRVRAYKCTCAGMLKLHCSGNSVFFLKIHIFTNISMKK